MNSQLFFPGLRAMRSMGLGVKMALLVAIWVAPVGAYLYQWAANEPGALGGVGLVWLSGLCLLAGSYLSLCFYLGLSTDLAQVAQTMDKVLQGDLRVDIPTHGRDEVAGLALRTHKMEAMMASIVANVRSNAAFVVHSSEALAKGSRELAQRTEQQAGNLKQTATQVDQLAAKVQANALAASQADAQSSAARDVADQSAATMARAISAVEAIEGNARRMDEIVGVIDGLAFQTNILALNAAVEAARAGESGRGFAVVASEVRSLAKRSADSAKEIRQLISASSEQVASSVQLIRMAGNNNAQIVSGIRDVALNMGRISSSSAEQSTGLSEITAAVYQLDEITQRNAHMVDQSVAKAANLEGQASTLIEFIAKFRLHQGSAAEAVELVERAIALHQRGVARDVARDVFLRTITDATQGYFDRDMYVFVLDRKGAYQAFGGNPAKVGTRVQDIKGIDGAGLLAAIFSQADTEPGWVEYDIANPTTGRVQAKMSFVQRVDDLAIGCGVYKNLAVN